MARESRYTALQISTDPAEAEMLSLGDIGAKSPFDDIVLGSLVNKIK